MKGRRWWWCRKDRVGWFVIVVIVVVQGILAMVVVAVMIVAVAAVVIIFVLATHVTVVSVPTERTGRQGRRVARDGRHLWLAKSRRRIFPGMSSYLSLLVLLLLRRRRRRRIVEFVIIRIVVRIGIIIVQERSLFRTSRTTETHVLFDRFVNAIVRDQIVLETARRSKGGRPLLPDRMVVGTLRIIAVAATVVGRRRCRCIRRRRHSAAAARVKDARSVVVDNKGRAHAVAIPFVGSLLVVVVVVVVTNHKPCQPRLLSSVCCVVLPAAAVVGQSVSQSVSLLIATRTASLRQQQHYLS